MQQASSQVVSVDAPIDGWNSFDALDNMSPTSAVVLRNLIPGAGVVTTRRGHVVYADLETAAPVETVASLDNGSDSALIAASAGGIWNITDTEPEVSSYAITEVAPPGTYTNDRWQHQNFRRADESGVLVLCNGEDVFQVYTG
jgi:hypothetical protein